MRVSSAFMTLWFIAMAREIYYASAHIEMDANSNMLSCHDVLDSIENDVRKQMKIQLVLHLDPLVTDDEETNVLKEKVNRIVRDLDVDLSIHDFRVVTGMKAKNVVFDVLVPRDFKMTDVEVREYLEKKISQEIEGKVGTVITIDHGFVTE